MMEKNENGTYVADRCFDEERAFYGSEHLCAERCTFDGPADGESAFKECTDISVRECRFCLRYPFWHTHGLTIEHSKMTPLCRAAIWYSDHIRICDSVLYGVKALRECSDVEMENCSLFSDECGWFLKYVKMINCRAESEYFMLRAENLQLSSVSLKGKYSFQYICNSAFDACTFDTKDAFWHAKNVLIRNSEIAGEYLGWYSDGLTLDHCRIIGTQPLCYCRNLRLTDCEMIRTDLCFEKSNVEASVTTPIQSIKNPRDGKICAPSIGRIICDSEESKAVIELSES